MKKDFKKVILVLFFSVILSNIFIGCNIKLDTDDPYPKGGRDTVHDFGNARFVILGPTKPWCLYDRDNGKGTLDNNVDVYKDIKPFAYVIGEKGFTKINYESGDIKQSQKLDDFENDDKKILKELNEKKNSDKK